MNAVICPSGESNGASLFERPPVMHVGMPRARSTTVTSFAPLAASPFAITSVFPSRESCAAETSASFHSVCSSAPERSYRLSATVAGCAIV